MPSPEEFDVLSRHSLLTFACRCFYGLNYGPDLIVAWYMEVIANALEAVRRGEIRRLVINVPPRHAKSLFGSVALPAWWLGHDPSAHIMCVSYAQSLSDKLSRDCQSVMQSDWYRGVFPATRLSARKQAVQEFETTRGGFRLATSIGGTVTGRGAHVIIVDDPHKPDEALSDTQRNATIAWFGNTLVSRLNDKRTGVIVLIMQRLHEGDLTGHVLEQGGWTVIRLPAIAEEDEVHTFETVFGPRRFVRRTGEALDPVREPLHVLERQRATMGEYDWAAQYQQTPVPREGGMIKREWLPPYRPHEQPASLQIVQSWDTANKATELSDYSVCTTWGVTPRHKAYLLHVLRARMDYPDLKRAAWEQYRRHRPTVVLIEDQASGIQLAQELVHEGMHAVKRYKPQLEKVLRMHAQTSSMANGLVLVPETAPWLDAYLHELTTFPRGKHDDQVDSTSQFLEWLKQRSMFPQASFGRYGMGG